jgi:uncharacterized membrane protein YkvA (DUF1232 family)
MPFGSVASTRTVSAMRSFAGDREYARAMPLWAWALVAAVLAYGAFVAAVALMGRGELARFLPDCIVLFRRLLADRRVPRRRRIVLLLLLAYLVSPIDLVPDFVPVAGHLDDAVVAALALRHVLRGVDPELLRGHWPGPPETLALLVRLSRRRGS